MTTPTPKPKTQNSSGTDSSSNTGGGEGASAHRQPQGGDGGGGGMPGDDGGSDGGSLLGGLGISNRKLLLLGVVAALAFAVWKLSKDDGVPSFEEEIDEALEDVEQEDAAPDEPNIEKDPNDPLKADEEALEWLREEDGN